jgi:integrase
MRRLDPSSEPFRPDTYVFGNKVGERVKSVHTAWVNACAIAGLKNFQLRDLRHEARSRFDEAGMPIIYVSNMLGHQSLTTTTRYLNVRRRGLHLAMQAYEESRVAIPLRAETETPTEPASEPEQPADSKSYIS